MRKLGTPVPESAEPTDPRSDTALGPAIALGVAFSVGALLVVGPLLRQIMPITPLPAPFPDTHQDAETLIYLVTFALLAPAGIVGAHRLVRRIGVGPNAGSLSAVAALLTAGVSGALVLTRLAGLLGLGGGPALVVTGFLWWSLALVIVGLATSSRARPSLRAAGRWSRELWALSAALFLGAVVCFLDLASGSVAVLVIGAALALVVAFFPQLGRVPSPPRWLAVAWDIGIVVLLALAVPNLVVFVTGDPAQAYKTIIIQYHQDFFLGPANQVLAGHGMLVDVLSQYGVGSIYFLSGAFLVLPIGNGTVGLVEGVLSALMFVAAFSTLRIAGVSRLLSGAALAVAVVVLVYGLEFPIGALLQHGAIRFGIPVGVVVGAVAESRWPKARFRTRGLVLLTIAVASIWALEAFAYTLLTAFAVVAFHAVARPAGHRLREIARWALQIGGAIAVGHLALALGTLIGTGSPPNWNWYLHTLREFLAGGIGDWTYDFTPFSWGLLVGAANLASAIAISTVMVRRRDLIRRQRTLMLAITAMTAWGIALFSYLVNRSADHIIPYVSLPVVAQGALWLSAIGRRDFGVSRHGRRLALVGAVTVSTLLVSVAWPSVGTRYSQSALAYAMPGGRSLTQGIHRLLDRPVIRSGSVEGREMLVRHMPGERSSIVIADADLSIEVLLRSGRASAIPFGDPIEDSFVPDGHYAALRKFLRSLKGGERMLLDRGARLSFDRYVQRPHLDPVKDLLDPTAPKSEMAPLQRWVLRRISQRFDLRTVATTTPGLEVVELVERHPQR